MRGTGTQDLALRGTGTKDLALKGTGTEDLTLRRTGTEDITLRLIGSISPWVLPERTLGTVRYTETYPGNYLICRTVPSLLQTVPSFQPPHSRSSRYLQKDCAHQCI